MKKNIITVLLFFIIGISAYAVNIKDTLSSIENGVFGYDYKNESDTRRVERLEEYMYGVKKSGTIQSRVDSLQNDSGIIAEDKKQKRVLQAKKEENKEVLLEPETKRKVLKEDETVEYTIVDKMEKELFSRTFKEESIYNRLNRLEMTVFQKTSKEDLNSRVDNLAAVLHPSGKRSGVYSTQAMDKMLGDKGVQPIDRNTLPFQLSALEHDIFRHDYNGDNNSSRLSRLEQKMFNRTFPNDADTQRFQRLLAACEAKKDSYKYENNKKMQNMATISQIGGILLMILAILL